MKYVILIYHNPQSRAIWEGMSDAEQAEGLQVYASLNEDLAASGELVVTQALADPSVGKRVLVRDGDVMTTDGPFAEAKEALAGFYLVECESIDRAIQLGALIPEAALDPEFGVVVEVRPIMVFSGLEM